MRSKLASYLVSAGCCLAWGQIQFQNVAQKAGIHFQLNNGANGQFHQIELMTGGVATLDYNNDGCADIFFVNGAASPSLEKINPEFFNRLYRNNCDGTFTDVTMAAGVDGSGYSNGVAAADYDNDGYTDLLITGVGHNILYRNRGNGTFENVTVKAGIDLSKHWSVSAGWLDADNDGYLDLFVTNYVAWSAASEPSCGVEGSRLYCHPSSYAGSANQIFRNNRDGTFTDVSLSSGIGAVIGKGMGVAFADFDGDGLMDIFVANDSVPNFLFRNLGGFHFREMGFELGTALPESGRAIAGMGADFRDYDNDGYPDLIVTGMVNDAFTLFRNLGRLAGFDDNTAQAGIAGSTRAFTGWGTAFQDFDNDGWKDLFFANSHFPELDRYLGAPTRLPNRIFRNTGKGFADVSAAAGPDFQGSAFFRGAAFADFDNDGRVDAVVTAIGSEALLFKNITAHPGHWLAFQLRGTTSNRDGIGSVIKVETSDHRTLYNHATTTVGYASSSERRVRFGLGDSRVARQVIITWPSGITQKLVDVSADRVVEVREPRR